MISEMNNVVLVVGVSLESLGMLNVAFNNHGYMAFAVLNDPQVFFITEKIELDEVLLDAVMPKMGGFVTFFEIMYERLKLLFRYKY